MEETKKLIEKYKRELMELSRTAPQPVREEKNTENKPPKPPQVIGYVSEESGEFPSVFDKFITDAIENNDIETVQNENTDMDEPEEETDEYTEYETDELTETPDETLSENDYETDENAVNENQQIDYEQGTGESISNFPVSEYSSYEEFEARNKGGGTLEFRVSEARGAFPVELAKIVVTTRIDNRDHEMFNAVTDKSGATRARILPAPPKALSQLSKNSVQPFALYDATVEKDGYTKVILRDIPIFDSVQSVQSVSMLPESEAGNTEEITEVPNAK